MFTAAAPWLRLAVVYCPRSKFLPANYRLKPYLLFALLAAAIIFVAACGGGVFPWSVCVVAVALSAANLFLCTPHATTSETRVRSSSLEWAYLAILAFLLISLVPLPLGLTRIAGPARYHQNLMAAAAIQAAAKIRLFEAPLPFFALSRNAAGTERLAILAIAMFAAARLASALAPPWKRRYIGQ